MTIYTVLEGGTIFDCWGMQRVRHLKLARTAATTQNLNEQFAKNYPENSIESCQDPHNVRQDSKHTVSKINKLSERKFPQTAPDVLL